MKLFLVKRKWVRASHQFQCQVLQRVELRQHMRIRKLPGIQFIYYSISNQLIFWEGSCKVNFLISVKVYPSGSNFPSQLNYRSQQGIQEQHIFIQINSDSDQQINLTPCQTSYHFQNYACSSNLHCSCILVHDICPSMQYLENSYFFVKKCRQSLQWISALGMKMIGLFFGIIFCMLDSLSLLEKKRAFVVKRSIMRLVNFFLWLLPGLIAKYKKGRKQIRLFLTLWQDYCLNLSLLDSFGFLLLGKRRLEQTRLRQMVEVLHLLQLNLASSLFDLLHFLGLRTRSHWRQQPQDLTPENYLPSQYWESASNSHLLVALTLIRHFLQPQKHQLQAGCLILMVELNYQILKLIVAKQNSNWTEIVSCKEGKAIRILPLCRSSFKIGYQIK